MARGKGRRAGPSIHLGSHVRLSPRARVPWRLPAGSRIRRISCLPPLSVPPPPPPSSPSSWASRRAGRRRAARSFQPGAERAETGTLARLWLWLNDLWTSGGPLERTPSMSGLSAPSAADLTAPAPNRGVPSTRTATADRRGGGLPRAAPTALGQLPDSFLATSGNFRAKNHPAASVLGGCPMLDGDRGSAHPSPADLDRFLRGELTAPQAAPVVAHLLGGCDRCRETIAPLVTVILTPLAEPPRLPAGSLAEYDFPLFRSLCRRLPLRRRRGGREGRGGAPSAPWRRCLPRRRSAPCSARPATAGAAWRSSRAAGRCARAIPR